MNVRKSDGSLEEFNKEKEKTLQFCYHSRKFKHVKVDEVTIECNNGKYLLMHLGIVFVLMSLLSK